ncbi:hypothetical protein EIP91_007011 [Steccherinum ochraceum]|uniref:Saccharopine dehydrogenase NADP binding domain-containing protein n=1 Tax=Steccherinum ochraceum TaxID=92696 RepID=A0A4R0RUX6_9APHY|nr:hypothetical protein EIP91_007011 [Steccherinum ochraceum]
MLAMLPSLFMRHSIPIYPYVEGETMIDILVLGATGYMGRLITDVLQHHRERPSFSFGIAARSQRKLEQLREELKLDKSTQSFEFDVHNAQQVESVVSQAAIIINTVGPYWNWGTVVVNACVKLGRHYVDLTGEPHWIREIITNYDYIATTKRCAIIPSCGLDSLPSDITAYLANRTLKALAGPEADIDLSSSAIKLDTSISAGSLRTFVSYVEDVPRYIRARMRDQFVLSNVKGVPSPPLRMTYQLPLSNPPVFGAAFVMANSNRAIVQRSWGLHEYDMLRSLNNRTPEKRKLSYGPQFKYEEFLAVASKTTAFVYSMSLLMAAICVFLPPTRWILKQILPFIPDQTSEEHKKRGFIEVTNVTSSVATPTKPPVYVRTVTRGNGEAGYYLSSFMITECALALLLNRNELPELGREGGVLTPTTALGDVLVRRLEETGKFNFHSEVVLGAEENRKTR